MNKALGIVRTSTLLLCDARQAWEKVCFYEHIERKPSWFLRTILPTPRRTTGSYRNVGDVSRCMYSDGGFLTKRIVRLAPGMRIDFDVIEQTIRYCGRMLLLRGGSIAIESLGDGASSVTMVTHYELRSPKLLFIRFLVHLTVKAMHNVVIRDMRDRLEARASRKEPFASMRSAQEDAP